MKIFVLLLMTFSIGCVSAEADDPGADFQLTHPWLLPPLNQQRVQGHRVWSQGVGRVGQFEDGVNTHSRSGLAISDEDCLVRLFFDMG